MCRVKILNVDLDNISQEDLLKSTAGFGKIHTRISQKEHVVLPKGTCRYRDRDTSLSQTGRVPF